MIRILVVDDHPIVREGLVAVLEDEEDFQVAGTAGTVTEALTQASRLRPDVALLDLELPDGNGADAIPTLLQSVPALNILVFTAYDTDERVFSALKAGAKGYLLKGVAAEEIARAIRALARGGSYLEPRIASRVLAEVGTKRRNTHTLSACEREVLRLVADGLSNKQIAHTLTITERTVKFHLTSLFNKLGADNRAQAVALAVQRGLL